jgi:hypothetical protein
MLLSIGAWDEILQGVFESRSWSDNTILSSVSPMTSERAGLVSTGLMSAIFWVFIGVLAVLVCGGKMNNGEAQYSLLIEPSTPCFLAVLIREV